MFNTYVLSLTLSIYFLTCIHIPKFAHTFHQDRWLHSLSLHFFIKLAIFAQTADKNWSRKTPIFPAENVDHNIGPVQWKTFFLKMSEKSKLTSTRLGKKELWREIKFVRFTTKNLRLPIVRKVKVFYVGGMHEKNELKKQFFFARKDHFCWNIRFVGLSWRWKSPLHIISNLLVNACRGVSSMPKSFMKPFRPKFTYKN
jgi:hypothetical protein